MRKNTEKKGISYGWYKIVRKFLLVFYPKLTVNNLEQIPEEPCVIISNHCQIAGPFSCELFFPGNNMIWCAGELCHKEQVAEFAYDDFFKFKSKKYKVKTNSKGIATLSLKNLNKGKYTVYSTYGKLTVKNTITIK